MSPGEIIADRVCKMETIITEASSNDEVAEFMSTFLAQLANLKYNTVYPEIRPKNERGYTMNKKDLIREIKDSMIDEICDEIIANLDTESITKKVRIRVCPANIAEHLMEDVESNLVNEIVSECENFSYYDISDELDSKL